MGGNAEHAIVRQMRQARARVLEKPGEAVGIIAEADLALRQRPPVAAAELVMYRQQGQADAAGCGGGGDALAHFAEPGIGRATGLVVQIVEFDIGGESGFEHFHLHEGGDRLDLVGIDAVEKAEHPLAPGPEAVGWSVRAARSSRPWRAGRRANGRLAGAGSRMPADARACGCTLPVEMAAMRPSPPISITTSRAQPPASSAIPAAIVVIASTPLDNWIMSIHITLMRI